MSENPTTSTVNDFFNESLNDSIVIIPDEKGREIRHAKDHPDKTRELVQLDESSDDGNQVAADSSTANHNDDASDESIVLENIPRRQANEEEIAFFRENKSGIIKEFLVEDGLGILRNENGDGIVLFHRDSIFNQNGFSASAREMRE